MDKNPVNFAIMWYLYIAQKGEKYYTGITTDVKNRLRQHGDCTLLYYETFTDKFKAARRERAIKGWFRRKKEELIAKFNPVSLP